jgi:hypothetical protein
VHGVRFPRIPLPYALLEAVFPPMKVSGMPVRMMVMVTLSAAVLCAAGVKLLLQNPRRNGAVVALFFATLVVESWHQPPFATPIPPPPEFVGVLKGLPGEGGILVMDEVFANTDPNYNQPLHGRPGALGYPLYFQTQHERPIAFGYVTRIQESIALKDQELMATLESAGFAKLWSAYSIRYLVAPAAQPGPLPFPLVGRIWGDETCSIYDLAELPRDAREVPFPVVPAATNQLEWNDGTGVGGGEDSSVTFALKEPRFVQAIRLRYAYEVKDERAVLQMFWRRSDQHDFAAEERHALFTQDTEGERTVTIPVHDTLDQFRIHPDKGPFVFHLFEIVLEVPPFAPATEPASDPPVYQPGTRIALAEESCQAYLARGWYAPDGPSRWSAREAVIRFRLEQVQPFLLRMMAATQGDQLILVRLNGMHIGTWHSRGQALQSFELRIPADLLRETNTLQWQVPGARSPKEAGVGDDRILGLRVAWLVLRP